MGNQAFGAILTRPLGPYPQEDCANEFDYPGKALFLEFKKLDPWQR